MCKISATIYLLKLTEDITVFHSWDFNPPLSLCRALHETKTTGITVAAGNSKIIPPPRQKIRFSIVELDLGYHLQLNHVFYVENDWKKCRVL